MQEKWIPGCRKLALGLIIASLGVCPFAMAKSPAPVPAKTAVSAAAKPAVAGQSAVQTPAGQTGAQAGQVPEGQVPADGVAEPVVVEPQIPTMAGVQVPGYYRVKVGQFEVTALFDGTLDFHPELLKNMDKAAIDKALSHHYGRATGIQSPINAYLVHTGEHLVLIDAGAGKLFSEDRQGRILANLKAAGYQPEQVDTIIMTHLHGDHTVFPNATVYANRMENEYWLSEQQAAAAPVERQIFFKMARESAVPYLMAEKWKAIEGGAEIVPGIRAVAAYGHTPGHTAFEITSDGQSLLVWGDIVHSHVIQFSHPEVAIEYDSDAVAAVRTRQALLKDVAAKRELVAGMHLPFPGLGYVVAEGDGKYTWIPVEYQ